MDAPTSLSMGLVLIGLRCQLGLAPRMMRDGSVLEQKGDDALVADLQC